jgi:hypothetical protein
MSVLSSGSIVPTAGPETPIAIVAPAAGAFTPAVDYRPVASIAIVPTDWAEAGPQPEPPLQFRQVGVGIAIVEK